MSDADTEARLFAAIIVTAIGLASLISRFQHWI
jgi:hypothetical protein